MWSRDKRAVPDRPAIADPQITKLISAEFRQIRRDHTIEEAAPKGREGRRSKKRRKKRNEKIFADRIG